MNEERRSAESVRRLLGPPVEDFNPETKQFERVQDAESVALVRASRERSGTCDNCADGYVPLPWESGDAWICQPCFDNEERAIKAAAAALRGHWERQDAMSLEECCARIVINAYWAEHSDGADHDQ